MGKQRIERYGHGERLVPFEAGELKAEARNGGVTVCTDSRATSGRAEKLNLRLKNGVRANGEDIAVITCYCTDKDGREVPDAAPHVSLFTNKSSRIIGTDSDITDHTLVNLPDRKMRAGRITAAIQVGTEAGELKVYAKADGLKDAVLTVSLG